MQRQPTPQQAREAIAAYYACVSFVDANVGRILEALAEQGLADNTIVFILGDHGFHLGDHGFWSKYSMLEATCRAAVGPRAGRPERPGLPRIRRVRGSAPYPRGTAGLECRQPGRNQLRAAPGGSPASVEEGGVHGGEPNESGRPESPIQLPGVPEGPGSGAPYDLRKDPWETLNLADDAAYAAARRKMADLLHAGWKAALPEGVGGKPF